MIVHGVFDSNGDSWLVMTENGVLLVDAPFLSDVTFDREQVSIVGTMGVPPNSPFEKLLAERIVAHGDIARRAFEFHQTNLARSPVENWLAAERELLSF